MRQRRTLIGETQRLFEVQTRTHYARDAFESALRRAEEMRDDPRQEERLGEQLCQVCFYLFGSRIGGAAITDANCRYCDVDMQFASTVTDQLCIACAKEHGLCKYCGGDVNMKPRHRPRRPRKS